MLYTSDSDDNNAADELDKKMGELGESEKQEETQKLDKNMWAPEEEENEEVL